MFNLKIRYSLIFFLLFSGYFILPLIIEFLFYKSDFIKNNLIIYNEYAINLLEYNIYKSFLLYDLFTILISFLVFFFFLFFLKSKNEANYKSNKILYFFLLFLLLLLILDIYKILEYRFDQTHINRIYLYEEILSGRRTHVNIILILSVAIYRENRTLSLLSYSLLLAYDALSFSRVEAIWLVLMHFIVNIDLNKRNAYKIISLIIILLIFLSYRGLFFSANWQNIIIDPLHLKLSSFRLFDELNNINLGLQFYFIDNLSFLLNDFFYFNFPIHDYFQSNSYERVYSVRGVDTLIIYLIPFIIYTSVFLLLQKKINFDQNLINSCGAYLLCIFFRGHFIHNVSFIIKLLILIFLMTFLYNKLTNIIKKS